MTELGFPLLSSRPPKKHFKGKISGSLIIRNAHRFSFCLSVIFDVCVQQEEDYYSWEGENEAF